MAEKKYWRSLEEKENAEGTVQENEFREELPVLNAFADKENEKVSANRRDFLKMLGFSVTAATVAAGCEMPVRKSIPFVIKPDNIIAGIPYYYASTYADGGDYCSVLVKTRDGRPIKIEGNELSKVTFGGTSAKVQGSILSLYDTNRPKAPTANGEESSWNAIDEDVKKGLDAAVAKGGTIVILSSTILSPSTKSVIKDFIGRYPGAQHITYDAISYSGILKANEVSFGKRVIPNYKLENAEVIVSFGADFLGTWISPIEYAYKYAQNRKVSKDSQKMSRHIQVESHMSLSGSNADKRIRVKPSEEGVALLHLYNVIASKSGAATTSNLPELDNQVKNDLAKTAEELLRARGKSVVLCDSNDVNAQLITNAINQLLDSYNNTIDFTAYSNQRQGDEAAMAQLTNDMNQGRVDALFLVDANPAYNYPDKEAFKAGLQKVGLTVSLNEKADETSALCKYVCPSHHYLESWNDAEPKNGYFSLAQPAIAPLFNTRSAADSFLKWTGNDISYYDYIRNYWSQNIYPRQKKFLGFNTFWDNTVQDGVMEANMENETVTASPVDVMAAGAAIVSASKAAGGVEVILYEKVAIGDGKHADNPWLLEMPDPVSRVTWDNYAAVSKKFAEDHNLNIALNRNKKGVGTSTDLLKLTANGVDLTLPVHIQPGLSENTVAIALGYGREAAGKAGAGIGVNAFPMMGKNFSKYLSGATAEMVPGEYPIAQTQHHDTINDGLHERRIVKETTLEEYKTNPYAGNEDREEVRDHLTTLYGNYENLETGHHWAMSIDLNSCIGCGACTIACIAENNVPVVGKDEVRRSREMHWIRIDRYYAGSEENPSVIFQPMLCQHCDNAPCENVCPVAATNHSSEGLNQMIYNRCIGTRYCANNCPYKVRRFNWFDYLGADSFKKGTIFNNDHDLFEMTSDLTRMVLNPDVAVRSRGVMEKCSFCVQRIQAGKLKAKKEDRRLQDSDITTACQQACPTKAIYFGDINNKDSKVVDLSYDERGFKVIEEIHTLPSITYLTKVRNKAKSEA